MELAIQAARAGIEKGQTPFGCAIAAGGPRGLGEVLAVCHNIVRESVDITAHAEVTALREACRRADSIHLEGAAVATTCEPCPMCMTALHWARVGTVYCGATIADARAAGFNEMTLPASRVLELGASSVVLVPGIREEECRGLFEQWKRSPGYEPY
jgi:tRNA(Arg) A34 adenosine deaminase TadA